VKDGKEEEYWEVELTFQDSEGSKNFPSDQEKDADSLN
jgi:hypothetical protein